MEQKPKLAGDLTYEDRWRAALDAFLGTLWGWVELVEEEFGFEKAEEMLASFARKMGEQMVPYWLDYFGTKTMKVPQMSQVADVIHELWDFKAPWTIESEDSGYETVESCPIWNAAPEKYKEGGVCRLWCGILGPIFYAGLGGGKARAEVKKSRPGRDDVCVLAIECNKE